MSQIQFLRKNYYAADFFKTVFHQELPLLFKQESSPLFLLHNFTQGGAIFFDASLKKSHLLWGKMIFFINNGSYVYTIYHGVDDLKGLRLSNRSILGGRLTSPAHKPQQTVDFYGMGRLFMKLVWIFKFLESAGLLMHIPIEVNMGFITREHFDRKFVFFLKNLNNKNSTVLMICKIWLKVMLLVPNCCERRCGDWIWRHISTYVMIYEPTQLLQNYLESNKFETLLDFHVGQIFIFWQFS